MYGTSGGGPIKEFRLGALGGRRPGGKRVIKARYPLLPGPASPVGAGTGRFYGRGPAQLPLRVGEDRRG